jgi:eukaryotic-like serine/threonine-protein kinase
VLKEGQILEGKYRLGRLLGRGGMGSVFLGEHTKIKRAVAIKVLHDEKADSENTRRFEREAEAAGRIGSDHIVEVLDFGTTPDGDRFMVMEYLDGETLKERLKRVRRLDPADAVPIIVQVLEGLSAAHAAEIIHRDLKPDNVFIAKSKAGRPDFVKIVDFGISKFNALTGEAGMMTQTGAIMGTPYYMSPEQARATNEVDARSDLYSVGVVLYEVITGAVPFAATTLTELMFKIVFEDPPLPQTVVPSLDDDFAAIVVRSMSRDPGRRFQSAQEMQAALASWNASRGSRRAPTGGGAVGTAKMPVTPEPQATRVMQSAPHLPVPSPEAFRSAPALPVAAPLREGFLFSGAPPGASRQVGQSSPRLPIPDAVTNKALPRPPRVAFTEPLAGGVDPTLVQQNRLAPTMDGPPTIDTTKVWNAPGGRPAPQRGRSGVLVVVALLIVAAVSIGWFLFARGSGEPRSKAADPTPSAAVAAPATSAASPSPSPSASARPSPSPSSSSKDSKAPEEAAVEPTPQPRRGRAIESAAPARSGGPARGVATTAAPKVDAPPPRSPAGAGTVKDFGY